MLIDLSCPIELRSYELLSDDAGVTLASVEMFNLSDFTVLSYKITVHCESSSLGSEYTDTISVDDVAIEGGCTFKLSLPLALKAIDKFELVFLEVRFDEGESWVPSEGKLVDVGELTPINGAELDVLKAAAGEDAVRYPETQDDFWRCVCGRINLLNDDVCYRCRRERDFVLKELNAKIIRMTDEAYRERLKHQKRALRAHRREKDANAANAYILILITALILFIMAFVYVGFIIPRTHV